MCLKTIFSIPGRASLWLFFYGPISVLLILNLFYFIVVVYRLNKLQLMELKKNMAENTQTAPQAITNNDKNNKSKRQTKKFNRLMSK